MEIEILKELQEYPERDSFYNEPIPIEEIGILEQLYNNGNPFPKALKELLFLAGNGCIVFDYGINDSQQELQEMVRKKLIRYSKTISQPFYVIDVYNAPEQFLFVYLDEGVEDPQVYEARYELIPGHRLTWIHMLPFSLSELINRGIKDIKNGQNPF